MSKFLEIFSNNQVLGLAIGFICVVLGIVGAISIKGGSLSLAWWQRILFLLIGGFVLWATNRPTPLPPVTSIEPGIIVPYAGAAPSDDSGWLVCDGREVSRDTYQALYAAIGDTWGAGNGSSTFNLPNFEATFVVGTTISNEVGKPVGNPTHGHTGGAAITAGSNNNGFGAHENPPKRPDETPPANIPHYNHTHDFTATIKDGSNIPPSRKAIFLIRAR